jgi:hypothetical protein
VQDLIDHLYRIDAKKADLTAAQYGKIVTAIAKSGGFSAMPSGRITDSLRPFLSLVGCRNGQRVFHVWALDQPFLDARQDHGDTVPLVAVLNKLLPAESRFPVAPMPLHAREKRDAMEGRFFRVYVTRDQRLW